MKKCLYCEKELKDDYYSNKVGYFCSEEHFDKYLENLSDEDYIQVQNSFCTCSDD
ncbi:MAG: hypothetical protein ACRDDY_00030 [Clostridium sp.]|uniref:hypothetical protein n=1 Tax=Clostridium sp. TaxID=1506 RepID=UPI003EE67B00